MTETRPDRKPLHAYVTPEAHAGWHDTADTANRRRIQP